MFIPAMLLTPDLYHRTVSINVPHQSTPSSSSSSSSTSYLSAGLTEQRNFLAGESSLGSFDFEGNLQSYEDGGSGGFLGMALAAAFGVMLLLEGLRFGLVPPLGAGLNRFMSSFVDSRDEGEVIVSHLYLLLGCAAPLWWSGSWALHPLSPYAGIFILGIGDAMVRLSEL
jgi:hypothetical protein